MSLTNKEKEAVNTCLMAIAKEIPRKLVSSRTFDPKDTDNGEYMAVKLGDVLNEMRKMIRVLNEGIQKDEG